MRKSDPKHTPQPPHTDSDTDSAAKTAHAKKSSIWKRLLKVTAWIAGVLAGLLVAVMCIIAWYLTPERLTPLVEKYAGEYLKADVQADRVELTVWSSFPSVRLDISNLRLTSRTLQGQPDSVINKLPADAARLFELSSFSGSINPWRLLDGTVSLGDVTAEGVGINLVSYAPGINNYDIVPPSEEEKKESEPWDIRFGKINVNASRGIRYYDVVSAIDLQLTTPKLSITPKNGNCELLATDFSSMLSASFGNDMSLTGIPLNIDGDIKLKWSPMSVELPEYNVEFGFISAKVTAGLDLGDKPALTVGNITTAPVKVKSLLNALPESLTEEMPMLSLIDTDMAVSLKAVADCPWRFDSPALPNVAVSFEIKPCSLSLYEEKGEEMLSLNEVSLKGNFNYVGAKTELSALNIPMCTLQGDGVMLTLSLMAEQLLGDNPYFTLTSKGHMDLKAAAPLLPGSTLSGTVEADASVKAHLKDILELNYENMEANGHMQLRHFLLHIPLEATRIYSQLANLKFGSTFADAEMGPAVPGTFRARADIDTLYCGVPGIDVGLGNAVVKAGTSDALLRKKNAKEITPMGMNLKSKRVSLNSYTDTMKVRVRDLNATGAITRFEGNAESPLLKAVMSAAGLLYSDPTMRLGVSKFGADLLAHLRQRDTKDKRTPYQRRYDRLAKRYPDLSADSIATLASHPRHRDANTIRPEVDNGVKDLFRQWGISGSLKADRIGLTHILYPARMRVSDLHFDFSLDSVRLYRAHIQTQKNALSVSGTISNIRQLMLGRTRRPLTMRLRADIDSIDINQVAYNFTLGGALQSQRGYLAHLSPEQEDAIVRAAAAIDTVKSESSDTISLLLPRNIDARLNLRADKARYTDINLYNLHTGLVVNDGAASIDSLTASTDFGDAYMNLLYSSRDPQLMNLALDLGFSNIDISKLFTTFPEIIAMAPALGDLSGMVGAKLVGSFDLFPNMDIDFSSLNAMLNISGSGLQLQQSPLIRKIARLMLIRKNGALNITDMDIQIAMHDNMVYLYPFKFGMEKYRFALLGENDLAQNMYYHLSVLKSPIPFKFGINVKGTFDKPKIRFGGAKYKENEAREMTNLIEGQRVNFVKAMRLELRKLINKATLSYAENRENDTYGVDKEFKKQDTQDDSEKYSSPIDMIGKALNAPAINAINKNKELIHAIAEKAKAEKEAKSKNKKGKPGKSQ